MVEFSTSLKEMLDMYEKKEKTLTENGAVAYKHSHKFINDFVFELANLRHEDWDNIGEKFSQVFYEEGPLIASKFFMWIADVREGAAERNVTKGIMKWMVDNHPEILEKICKYIPGYSRWDILILLADSQFNSNEELRQKVVKIIENQFVSDLRNVSTNYSVSLLAKWMPSENASSQNTRRLARQLQSDLNVTPKNYRKGLTMLRHKLHVVECDMSANQWKNIDYEAVPSKANLNYANAFMRHDKERRTEYLNSLKNGEVKINSKVLAPYEIIRNYSYNYSRVKEYNEALEQMWKALPQYQMNDTLVVRDGSGSMTDKCTGNTTCLDVATAVAIYAAEHNSKNWKDKFITFSSKPEFVDMSKCFSLREKIALCNRYCDCSNTDIYSTMRLILNVARKNKYKQSQMPKNILIISDMAFDAHPSRYYWARGKDNDTPFNYNDTLFEKIQKEYAIYGYKLPKLIFWNVNARGTTTIPVQDNELGMSLVSGFSANMFKMVMSEELDPYEQLLCILNSERYKPVEQALQA